MTPSNGYAKLLYDYFREVNVTYYNQNFCYTLCYQDKLINKCSCGDIIAPSLRNSSFCANESEMNCLNQFNAFFTISDINSICENACPEQCSMINYEMKISQTSFPTHNYLKIFETNSGSVPFNNNTSFGIIFNTTKWDAAFPKNVSDDTLIEFARQTSMKVKINYDSLYYTVVNETPLMDLNGLIGTLGGQLGLFYRVRNFK